MASGYNLQSLSSQKKNENKELEACAVRTKCRPTVTTKLAIAVAAKTAT
jgi:hypothetical protein